MLACTSPNFCCYLLQLLLLLLLLKTATAFLLIITTIAFFQNAVFVQKARCIPGEEVKLLPRKVQSFTRPDFSQFQSLKIHPSTFSKQYLIRRSNKPEALKLRIVLFFHQVEASYRYVRPYQYINAAGWRVSTYVIASIPMNAYSCTMPFRDLFASTCWKVEL